MEKGMKVDTFSAEDVKHLEIKVAAAVVWTKEASDGEIRVEAKNLRDNSYICELNAGKLAIIYEYKGAGHFGRSGREGTRITVYLPAKLTLGQVTLEFGAGEIYTDAVPISCRDMNVEVGAGKWSAARLSVSGRLQMELGAGKAKMKEITAGRLGIECGVGSCDYEGRVDGEIRVSCGMGSCSLLLENKESDFNYDISCAMGSVRVNRNRINSVGVQKYDRNAAALGNAVLECGLGSIELQTGQNVFHLVK